MPQKIDPLQTLPGVDLQAIKDGWREVAFAVSNKQQYTAARAWFALRSILRTDGIPPHITPRDVQELEHLIVTQRCKILELLQDTLCLKNIAGSSEREKDARMKLAWEVLDEVLVRIADYQLVER